LATKDAMVHMIRALISLKTFTNTLKEWTQGQIFLSYEFFKISINVHNWCNNIHTKSFRLVKFHFIFLRFSSEHYYQERKKIIMKNRKCNIQLKFSLVT
jgi:hypothetical protein